MKKSVFIFILLFALSTILSGCGTKNEVADTPSPSVDPEIDAPQSSTPVEPDVDASQSSAPVEPDVDAPQSNAPVDPDVDASQSSAPVDPDVDASQSSLTEQMAYDGVNNYCRSMYDWSIAEGNPDIMGLTMGEETESEYQVIFRSYTGAFVYFYVDKSSGMTRLVEYVPILEIEEEAGTIDLYDYLESDET